MTVAVVIILTHERDEAMKLKTYLRKQFDATRPGVTEFALIASLGFLIACAATPMVR